jgi:uncharacterized membrane protein
MSVSDQPTGHSVANVNLVYYLYLAAVVLGLTAIVGVIMAYMNRTPAGDWLDSHYRYQIRTFWIGLLYGIVGGALTMVLVGILVLIFALVWWIVRCVKGLKLAGEGKPVPDPGTWMW